MNSTHFGVQLETPSASSAPRPGSFQSEPFALDPTRFALRVPIPWNVFLGTTSTTFTGELQIQVSHLKKYLHLYGGSL